MTTTLDTSDQQAWSAVLERDGTFDGRFVYAVTTTGVYCRPGCPSRRPRRDNVRFFETCADAVRAGFRACRRCRPAEGSTVESDAVVTASLTWLDDHLDEDVSLDALATAVDLSPAHIQRRFKAATGISPKQFVTARRLIRFRARVKAGDDVTRATYAAGFGSSRGLYSSAKVGLGMTPGRYARGGAGLDIAWTVDTCSLGTVLVASTTDGVCAVLLGDGEDDLHAQLRDEFGKARLTRDDTARRDWTRNVIAYLDDTQVPLAVPLDHHGTPFQVRVWKALREIPAGTTRTYAEVARAIDAPRAVRAVGRACGQNAIAVLVPCHRVIRKDGSAGGYRWGLRRKTALLDREASDRVD